jgi:hypothetical protein
LISGQEESEKYFISLSPEKMQIKTTMRYDNTHSIEKLKLSVARVQGM